MKRYHLIISLISFMILACKGNKKPDPPPVPVAPVNCSTLNCYRYTHNKDTITLKLLCIGDHTTGVLVYDWYEKDRNVGTFTGSFKDKTFFADYTFMSEGVESKRPVAFKLDGNKFIEGYGETETINGHEQFKNKDSLDYPAGAWLIPVDCNN